MKVNAVNNVLGAAIEQQAGRKAYRSLSVRSYYQINKYLPIFLKSMWRNLVIFL